MRKLFLLFLFLFSLTCAAQIRVNVGGPQYTDTSGNIWLADYGCSSTGEYTYAGNITGTVNPTLYKTGRNGGSSLNCTYSLVSANYYMVTLLFAETDRSVTANTTGPGANPRLMNIIINGKTVATGVNVLASCGFASACNYAYGPIESATGQFSVTITQQHYQPMLAAISIIPVGQIGLDASQISYLYPNSNAALQTVQTRLQQALFATDFGVTANGTGSGGTSQDQKVSNAIAALGSNGGVIIFPPASQAYVLDNLVISTSHVSFDIQPGAVAQKLHGSLTGPMFQFGNGVASITDVHIRGGGTLDGNRNNISFSGDGFSEAVAFVGASDSSVEGMTIKNAATDNVGIACLGSYTVSAGNNVQVLNNIIDNAKRQNVYLGCGTNTVIRNNVIRNATGGSLSLGIDFEPNQSGQVIAGSTIIGNNIYGNRDGCIQDWNYYDAVPITYIQNNNCHDNGASAQFSLSLKGSTLGLTGYAFVSNNYFSGGTVAALSQIGFLYLNLDNNVAVDSVRGLFVDTVATTANITNGVYSGSSYDVDVNSGVGATCKLAGVTLVHGTDHFAACQYEMTIQPASATQYGLSWWNGNSPRDGAMTISSHFKMSGNDAAASPAWLLTDGTITGKCQDITSVGFFCGAQSNHNFSMGTNNVTAAGSKGNLTLYTTGGLRLGLSDYASLGVASPSNIYQKATVTDSTTQVNGAVYTGGGALFAMVVSDGSNWRVYGGGASTAITSLTGDVTATGPGAAATTLSSVGSAGSCGDATHSCTITFDAKGRETSQSQVSITTSGVTGGTCTHWTNGLCDTP